MNALLNEYRYWRDKKIETAFSQPVTDWNELKEYVLEEFRDFHYQYSESITLKQYKHVQWELMEQEQWGGVSFAQIIDEPLIWWCSFAIEEDDWEKLFNDHEPETESEEQA